MSSGAIEEVLGEGVIQTYFNSTEIEMIVFDLHGTITNRTSIHPYHIQYRNDYIKSKLGFTVDESFNGGTDEAFSLFPELDKYEFYRHRDQDLSFRFDLIHKPNPELQKLLRLVNDKFNTVLYTDSYLKQIERTLQSIGINGLFNKLIGLESGHHKFSSQHLVYPSLCAQLGIEMKNVLIIGDRMDKDINPVLKSGGSGIRVESSKYIIPAVQLLLNTFTKKR
ncbi:MAG: HAD family hydrolase [Bacteroidia bacterium]|nr:HAD family hydrolase [Bacteroidia bacterium]